MRSTTIGARETALSATHAERDRHRLDGVTRVLQDFRRTAEELDRECARWALVGEQQRAERSRVQAEQIRLCCVRLAAALREPAEPTCGGHAGALR